LGFANPFDYFHVNGYPITKANRVPEWLSVDMGAVPLLSALASDNVAAHLIRN